MHHPWLRFRLPVALFSQLIGFCLSAQAQTMTSATSAATAGSGRASVEATDVHALNPAILVHLRDRDIHAVGTGDRFMVGLTDNTRGNLMAAGISFDHAKVGRDEDVRINEDIRLSLGDFATEHIAFGISGHQFQVRTIDGTVWKQVNGDVAFSWAPRPILGFALVGYDLLRAKEEIPGYLQLPSRVGLGFQSVIREFIRLRADLVSGPGEDWTRRSLSLGYESYVNQFALFRLGVGEDRNTDARFYGLGVGFELPKFRLNYAYQSGFRGDFETRHSVDLGIPF